MSVSSVDTTIRTHHSAQMDAAERVGRNMKEKNDAYLAVVGGDDPAATAKAEIARQEAVEGFASFMAVMQKGHDMMMQLFQMLAR